MVKQVPKAVPKNRIFILAVKKFGKHSGLYPSEEMLKKMDLSRRAFFNLSSSRRPLRLREAIVVAEWLECDIKDLEEYEEAGNTVHS